MVLRKAPIDRTAVGFELTAAGVFTEAVSACTGKGVKERSLDELALQSTDVIISRILWKG